MAKTRSKYLNSTIKEEERENKPKPKKELLYTTNDASKTRSKITKNRTLTQMEITRVKSENEDDNKELLASPKKNTLRRSKITAEKIAKLIGYVVNDKVNVVAASRKVGINETTAYKYYHDYQDDPEHRIPLPKTVLNIPISTVSQEKINNLTRYIVNDGMNVTQASKKADMHKPTAVRYYAKYLEDPEQKIPLLNVRTGGRSNRYTQKEVTDLIGCIVRDKMSLVEASRKVNISQSTARRYYIKYLQNPNHDITDPRESNPRSGKRCTNDQVSSLIGYIVNDEMSLSEASIKAHMSERAASKYYKQYLEDPEKNIPTPETCNSRVSSNPPTVDRVKTFFCYVIIDKLNVAQAARKAKILEGTSYLYYKKYLKNPNDQTKIKDMSYSADKMKRLVEVVQNEKMSLREAADVVDLNIDSARKHYKQYLKDPQYEFPESKSKHFTQEDIKKLIDCVEHDKMSLNSAARRIKMGQTAALRYYKIYQNDPEHKIPAPAFQGQTKKCRELDKYTRIVDDIYKNNPSIKPIYQSHDSELDVPDIKIKKELTEADTETVLKTENS